MWMGDFHNWLHMQGHDTICRQMLLSSLQVVFHHACSNDWERARFMEVNPEGHTEMMKGAIGANNPFEATGRNFCPDHHPYYNRFSYGNNPGNIDVMTVHPADGSV